MNEREKRIMMATESLSKSSVMESEQTQTVGWSSPGEEFHSDNDSISIPNGSLLLGICKDNNHPVLHGRCLVGWQAQDGVCNEAWLPCVNGIDPQVHDTVLITKPDNYWEPIISGVVDGLHEKATPHIETGPVLTLKQNESLCIRAADGKPLLTIQQTAAGPVVQLLNDDVTIATSGKLHFQAAEIDLTAKQGSVSINAADDVQIVGETINLN